MFNWVYCYVNNEETLDYEAFEGVWGSLPLFVTGVIGLSTARGDNPCKRISLIISGGLTIPFICSLYIPLAFYLEDIDYSHCSGTDYNYNHISHCLQDYIRCIASAYPLAYCESEFEGCLYKVDCAGSIKMYAVIQMMINTLALITNVLLLFFAVKHHNFCGLNCCDCGYSENVTVQVMGHSQPPPLMTTTFQGRGNIPQPHHPGAVYYVPQQQQQQSPYYNLPPPPPPHQLGQTKEIDDDFVY